MPINLKTRLRRLSQAEFGELAYTVMGCVFEIHQDLGRLFDEKIYKRELAHRLPGVQLEVPLEVRHETFAKTYYLDVVVGDGGLFEFKAAEAITPRHRAQTLNYLHLAELAHAKLVNLRPEQVEHEFVNTSLTRADRLGFQIQCLRWDDAVPGGSRFREVLTSLLQDWGTCLELPLYEEAVTHFFGGEARMLTEVPVRTPDHVLGHQKMRLVADGVAFVLTALGDGTDSFEAHAQRLIRHTDLRAILWADIGLRCVRLVMLK
jgi:GxxExxY protein